MRPPQAEPNRAALAERDAKIMRLRIAGWTLARIGEHVGLSTSQVHTVIGQRIAAEVQPAADELRALEITRLDDLLARAYTVMADGEASGDLRLKAIDRALRVAERRAKLLGLDSPVQLDVALEQRLDVEADAVASALVAALDVLDLDEQQRQAALGAAQAALMGQDPPVPAPAAAAQPGEQSAAADEQARREAEFRALMAADGVDPDALLADVDDDQEDADG